MSQKKKNHVTRSNRRDLQKRLKQAEEVRQAIDAIGRKARQRRNGDLSKRPGKES